MPGPPVPPPFPPPSKGGLPSTKGGLPASGGPSVPGGPPARARASAGRPSSAGLPPGSSPGTPDIRLPSALQRSDPLAQRTYVEAHDNALREYGDEAQAFATAWAAVERHWHRVGDRWVPKDEDGSGSYQI